MKRQLWFLLILHLCIADIVDDDPYPLHTAAIEGDLNLVIHLLQGGADINQQNDGWLYTPLHYAAYYGREEVVRHLLANNASKTIKGWEEVTAYTLATGNECNSNNKGSIKKCKEASWDYNATRMLLLAAAVCSPRCGHGKCVSPNKCNCFQGWTGSLCQTPVCSQGCGHGECVGPNRCNCNQGWTGSLCQTPPTTDMLSCTSDMDCPRNQMCDGGECKDVCSTNTCKTNEICSVVFSSGSTTSNCKCPDGFFVDTNQTCKKSESCTSDMQCPRNQMCDGGDCKDVCSVNTCKKNEICSVVFSSGSTTSNCKCPDGFHVDTDQTCKKSESEEDLECFLPSDTDSNIVILKCGTGETSICVNNNKVPDGTDVMVACWRSPAIIVRCTNKAPIGASWDVCDSSYSCEMPLTRLVHLCQQEAPNAQYCGYRPPYYHSPSAVIQQNTGKEWPWLVGIFVLEKYVCTGTLISVRYVLSAAHCTARSKSSKEPREKLDVKLQHINVNGIKMSRIDKIIHHPQFRNGPRPENDISLLRLQDAVTFSKGLMPACVAKQLPLQPESAVAFKRNKDDTYYKWKTLIRKLDSRCQTSRSGNSCQLEIKARQFCSSPVSLFPGPSTVIEEGSSGGPYIVNIGTEEYEKQSVVGVASYRVKTCGDPFTVYTDITAFSTWINYCLDTALNATQDCHSYTGF